MRGDGVGVGDIGEVQGDARSAGDTSAGDDGWPGVLWFFFESILISESFIVFCLSSEFANRYF